MTLHKMAGERQNEREATFQFIEEVHNCLAVWNVSSATVKDTKDKLRKMEASLIHAQKSFEGRRIFCAKLLDERVVHAKGGISADIRFRSNLSISLPISVSSLASDIK